MQQDFKLGRPVWAALFGFVMAAMVVSYYMGYKSGQSVGYDNALQENLATIAKYPIADDEFQAALNPDKVSEVYAKLGDEDEEDVEEEVEPLVPLDTVKEAVDAPLLGGVDALAAGILEDSSQNQPKRGLAQDDVDALAKQLNGTDEEDTLGALLDHTEKKIEEKKEENAKIQETPKPTPTVTPTAKPTPKVTPTPKITPAPTPKPTPALAAAVAKVTSGWYVSAGVKAQLSGAQAEVERLKALGFPATIDQGTIPGQKQPVYRVVVGPERSRELADRLSAQLARERVLADRPSTRYIK